MTAYFAIDYTIHFDDTMAYGGHHFLTAFKLQCASREAFLFGERIFDQLGVKEALDQVHLLTSDAYARNLQSMRLGDRVAILLSLEQWGRASARFCYRVLNQRGDRVCAGFQTLICADAQSGEPRMLPTALSDAMNQLRAIEEHRSGPSFREIVLAGGHGLDELFGDTERNIAIQFLSDRYPRPSVVQTQPSEGLSVSTSTPATLSEAEVEGAQSQEKPGASSTIAQAWLFAGQGAFDDKLFCQRLIRFAADEVMGAKEIIKCEQVAKEYFGDPVHDFFSADIARCRSAVQVAPGLVQIAILLQNILGARLWQRRGNRPSVLMGHSFGEIAAFQVGGCFDLPTAVRIVCLRHLAIERYAPAGCGMAAVFAERHLVRAEASFLGLSNVCVAGRNYDTQTVASGPLDQLKILRDHLHEIGVQTTKLQSPTSFHHPDLNHAAKHWYESMRGCSMQAPQLRVYSPIGRRLISQDEDLAGTLASQLLRPFDIQGSLHDIAAMGIKQVVDCGSTGSLARLLKKAAPENIESCCSASCCSASVETPVDTKRVLPLDKQLPHQPEMERLPVSVITGRGCILPAGATSPEKLFESLVQQRVGLIDQRTKDPHWVEDFYSETLVPDRSTSHLSGQVSDADILCPLGVDRLFFESLTRTQRLFCMALSPCLPGLRDAKRILCLIGMTADGFEDQDEASSLIFAGIDPLAPDVDRLMNSARSGHRTPHQTLQSVLDHMIGPGIQLILVDAACASSLYTTALGMRILETDRADAVIVGGVFCPGPGNSCLFSQFRGTTSTGCRPFDANADGVVFSEGSAVLTLRRSSDVARLGLNAVAAIRGAGLSSDGRSSSANVPQSHGQILSLQRCYRRYSIEPTTIAGIEGHGTSTPVGDSTEVETLRQFFAQHVDSPIPLHSLKGSIGHAGWAAGTASVIAATEYLRRRTIPKQGFFSKPSLALEKAKSVLAVTTTPIHLRTNQTRIAVDGFGFGGANAHLVIDLADTETLERLTPPMVPDSKSKQQKSKDQEIVLVALHQIEPSIVTQSGLCFDRNAIKLPKDFIVLPELADDMDISQTLAVLLVHQIIQDLPGFNSDLRNDTSVVLAMRGKTERGVEATMRVLSERLKRKLSSNPHHVASIEETYNRSRPSRAYTLQCMMPNVASGRAALLHNLRGANFVVDAGDHSLDASLLAASLLLEDEGVSAKIAVVASVSACSGSDPHHLSHQKADEHAAAFALTTKSIADQFGWKPLLGINALRQHFQEHTSGGPPRSNSSAQLQSLIHRIRGDESKIEETMECQSTDALEMDTTSTDSCQIHTPVWVEAPSQACAPSQSIQLANDLPVGIFVVQIDNTSFIDLLHAIPQRFSRARIIMIGGDASHIVAEHPDHDLHWIESLDEPERYLELIRSFSADFIVAIQCPKESSFRETLKDLTRENTPCEALFLAAKHEIDRLNAGNLELWSLVVNGWSGLVHPSSGPAAGLLKSISREIPDARVATLCTNGLSIAESLDGLLEERRRGGSETEIVLDVDKRLVRRLVPVTRPEFVRPQVNLDANSVVIASGGARGVTAVMLEALVRDYGCTIIALGRSPLESGPANTDDLVNEQDFYRRYNAEHPQVSPAAMRREFESTRARWEAARNIDFLRSIGGKVEYHEVDVTNSEMVSRLIADIAHRYGRVDLLIHGAGVQISKKLQHRSLAEFRKTYQVKVSGLHLLVDSCLEQFGKLVPAHVLTSAYSIFGNDGQHDYCAANETMDRLCAFVCHSNASRWSSLAWLAWQGIGMTRGTEYRALAKQRSLSGVDEATGQRLFRAVITGRTGVAINVPMSHEEHTKYSVFTIPKYGDGFTGRCIEIPIDLNKIACLPYHKVRETPTLPGAWIVHHFLEAASKFYPEGLRLGEACVQRIAFLRFIQLQHGHSPNLRVIAQKADQHIHVWMVSDVLHSSGQLLAKDVHCARATIIFRSPTNQQRTLDDLGIGTSAASLIDPYCRANSTVSLSGPFRCIREISIGRESRRARFHEVCSDCWSMTTPALALDAAWRLGAMYADPCKCSLFVPVAIEELVLPFESHAEMAQPKNWTIVSTAPRVEQEGARWSRTEVCDESGRIKILVKNAFAKPIGR